MAPVTFGAFEMALFRKGEIRPFCHVDDRWTERLPTFSIWRNSIDDDFARPAGISHCGCAASPQDAV
jgi:hypothetical protein